MKESNEIRVVNKSLHEIKLEILLDYTGEFEMVGNLKIGDQIRQTHIRFRNISDCAAFIISIDEGYDAEDAICNGCLFNINTAQFNLVNRSQYGNGCDFKLKLLNIVAKNCFVPTKAHCFVKCINYFTGQDYKQQYLDFIGNEKRTSNIMTQARIQPFCRANNNNLGYYNDDRVFPRSVTEKNKALYLFKNHFCVIWKSESVSFNQAIKEIKDNFNIVDIYTTNENVNSCFKYEFIPQKIESHSSIFIVYDLETPNTDRARPYVFCFYRLSKIAGRYNRDQALEELDKCRKDAIAFDGDN